MSQRGSPMCPGRRARKTLRRIALTYVVFEAPSVRRVASTTSDTAARGGTRSHQKNCARPTCRCARRSAFGFPRANFATMARSAPR